MSYGQSQAYKAARRREKDELEVAQFWVGENAYRVNYAVKVLNPYQFRIEGEGRCVDFWPAHQRWMNIKSKERGHYRILEQFLNNYLIRK